MRGLKEMILVNLKLYLREPIATFFTLAFPPMLVLIFGAMYGNAPMDIFGGRGSMDIAMPGYTAMILGTVGLLGVPITISSYRELGILRRFQAAGVPPLVYILADVVANVLMTLLGMVALLVVASLLYQVHFDGQPLLVLAAVVFACLAMFSVGYVIASLSPGARTAQVVGMAVMYPMIFLSGAGMPLEVFPESLRRVSNLLPLTYVVKLLRGLWFGEAWGQHLVETAVLAALLGTCAIVAARSFRWE